MLDLSHIPSQYPNADVQVFVGGGINAAQAVTWQKPRGKSMGHILIVGPGGNGGAGVIGANSLAGGGGGGGSGGQTSLRFPLHLIPDTLFLYLPQGGVFQNAQVSISDNLNASNIFAQAGAGAVGGNGTAVPAGGVGGSGGGAVGSTQLRLGWQFIQQAIGGQTGATGGTTGAGSSVALPTSGLLVTAGASGAGLVAAAVSGGNGGRLTPAGVFGGTPGASGAGAATFIPESGAHGYQPIPNLLYYYGGSGGASTHGSATGAGLVQASGGDGAPGCGGGGSGAALTGSTPGVVGLGGPAFCIITCW